MFSLNITSRTSFLEPLLVYCTSNVKDISALKIELSWLRSNDNIQIRIYGLSSINEKNEMLNGLLSRGFVLQ